MTPRDIQQRALKLLLVMSLAFLGLIGQLGNLQFRQSAAFTARARENYTQKLTSQAPRGVIYDRNRQRLVDSRLVYSVVVSYDSFDNSQVLHRLSDGLHVNYDKLLQSIQERKKSRRYYDPVEVKSDITPEESTWIAEHHNDLPGVFTQRQPVRDYLAGPTAGHVIGYARLADAQDVAQKNISPQEIVGKSGLEAFYDSVLRGQNGQEVVEVDAQFRPLGVASVTPPVRGNSLVLSLDSRIQSDTEKALDYGMWQIRHRVDNDGHVYGNANRGAAVMLDVHTGEVLAMASLPGYDPNIFVKNDDAAISKLFEPKSLNPEWNRAIAGAYQPGSVFKLVTTVAAFTEGTDNAARRIFCGGVFSVANKRCWTWQSGGHGWTDIYKAISESCDIYFYQLGQELGIDKLVKYMQDMGLGRPTGIDLVGEESGSIPSASWRDARAKDKSYPQDWQPGDTLSAAIGQIVTVTPLQLAQYTAWIANGGLKVKPHLINEVLGADGSVKQSWQQPAQLPHLLAADDTINTIHQAMKLSPFGVGTAADGWWERFPIKVAAKTGTAENPPHDEYGTWIGYAPADNPQVALAVVVEEAGHGGNVTPIARAMFAAYFKVQLAKGDPAVVPANWVVGADPAKAPKP